MSGIYDVTLPAGQVANLAAFGDYFKVRSAPFGLVGVKVDGGESFALDEGLGVRMPAGKSFRDLTIKNNSASTQTILIFVGDSRFEDTRITGTVRVIDQAADKTRAGKQFIGSIGSVASATLISCASIGAAGASVAIKRCIVSSVAGGTAFIFRGTAQGTATPQVGGVSNKFQGAASSVSRYGTGNAVALPLTAAEQPGYAAFFTAVLAPSGSFELPITTPLVIDGNNVLGAYMSAINKDITLTIDYEEQ